MYLYMKQRIFTLGQQFDIWDYEGSVVYTAASKIISFGQKMRVFDRSQREILYIEQQVFSLPCRFRLYVQGRHEADVVKRIQFFRQDYDIEGLNWRVDGDVWGHEYTVNDASGILMRIQKKWMTWSDTYELNIADRADHQACLGIALAIDMHLAQHD